MTDKQFIVFEGTEGAGKTTLLNGLCNYLETRKRPYERFREPGTGVIGTKIREILLDLTESPDISLDVQVMLFSAAYRNTLETVVLPALKEGKFVLSDRTNISSKTYQADSELCGQLTAINDALCLPDVVFIMTTDYETLQKRMSNRGGYSNWRDNPRASFHNTLRDRYLKYAEENPDITVTLDTSKSPEELLKEVISYLFPDDQ